MRRVQITPKRDIYTPEDRLDRFPDNAQATNRIEVSTKKKKQFGVLDNKSLIRHFFESLRIFTRCLYFDSPYGFVKIRRKILNDTTQFHVL